MSLTIPKDDRASLAELHRFLHGDLVDSPIEEQPLLDSHRISGSSYSFKSERRLSLPTRTSMAPSTTSEIPVPPPKEPSNFQLRRRRAAKLTHFFGVDYRELIHDILESIEKGVEEERKRGTLRPEEVEVSSFMISRDHSLTLSCNASLCCISFTIFGQDRMGFYNNQYYITLLPSSTFYVALP
jgi:hypothetical protein